MGQRRMRSLIVLIVLLMVLIAASTYVITMHNSLFIQPQVTITVSTTTSLYQIGVLDTLLNDFNNFTHANVKFNVLAKGSGEALRLLADGSACFAFVHAPSLELQYLEQGKIERLAIFAYNEFIIVGPRTDPANVNEAQNAIEAFKRIYYAGERGLARFVSRGDLSGTNVRELQIWRLANLSPEGKSWYLKTSQGMAQTLIMADNIQAYTLTDIGSWLKLKNQGKIQNLVELEKDPSYLLNVYSFYISKSPACNNTNILNVAYKFKEYITSRGQDLIIEKYKGLLNPVRGNETMVLQSWEALTKLK